MRNFENHCGALDPQGEERAAERITIVARERQAAYALEKAQTAEQEVRAALNRAKDAEERVKMMKREAADARRKVKINTSCSFRLTN